MVERKTTYPEEKMGDDPALYALTANAHQVLKRDIVIMVTMDNTGKLSLEWRAKTERLPIAKQLVSEMFARFFTKEEVAEQVRAPGEIPSA